MIRILMKRGPEKPVKEWVDREGTWLGGDVDQESGFRGRVGVFSAIEKKGTDKVQG